MKNRWRASKQTNTKWMKVEEAVRGHGGKAREGKSMNSQIFLRSLEPQPTVNGWRSASTAGGSGKWMRQDHNGPWLGGVGLSPRHFPGFCHQMIEWPNHKPRNQNTHCEVYTTTFNQRKQKRKVCQWGWAGFLFTVKVGVRCFLGHRLRAMGGFYTSFIAHLSLEEVDKALGYRSYFLVLMVKLL